jgi:hypothetical protein
MKRLLLATVITFAPFVVPAHATDLTGEALALACEGNVPGIKRGKNTEEYAKFCNTYINGWEDAIFAFLKGTTTYCPPQVTVKEMSVVFFDYLAAHKEARRLPAAYSGCNTSSRSCRVSNPLARYHNASRRQRIYLQHPRLSIETGATAQCSPEPRRSFSGLGVICHLAPTSVAVTPQGCGQKKSKPNPANYRRSSAGGPNRKRAIDLLEAASRLRHPPYRTLHSLMPPLRLMNSASGSLSFFCICAYRGTLLLLLRVRLSTFTESAVHRMIAANGSSGSDTSSSRVRSARRRSSFSRNWLFGRASCTMPIGRMNMPAQQLGDGGPVAISSASVLVRFVSIVLIPPNSTTIGVKLPQEARQQNAPWFGQVTRFD